MERLENRELLSIGVQNAANFNLTNPWGKVTETAAVGNLLYFVAAEPSSNSFDLWRSDGTTSGTIRLTSLGPDDRQPRHLTNVNGTLYFRGYDSIAGHELWKSNGTVAGTTLIRDLRSGAASSSISDLISFNGTLYFSGNGDLFRSNGTSAGTLRVRDFFVSASDEVSALTQVGNAIYFRAKSTVSGFDLYRTNGTNTGTSRIGGISGALISDLTDTGGRLYFVANRTDLWTADSAGGPATRLIGNAAFGNIEELTNVNGRLFFTQGSTLHTSDGTSEGTTYLPGGRGFAYGLFNGQGTLYFSAGESFQGTGQELWRSDGTQSGTFQLREINPDFFEGYGFGSYPRNFTIAGGTIYFTASDSTERDGFWTTDGTSAGTRRLENGGATHLTNVSDTLLFFREASGGGLQLQRLSSGATASMTIPRTGPGTGNSSPGIPVAMGGDRFLFANDGVTGTELRRWRANGTLELVSDISPGPTSSIPSQLVSAGGLLYFSLQNSSRKQELWRSDGTAAGTFALATVQIPLLPPGSRTSGTSPFVDVGGTLYFTGVDQNGSELWKTDGSLSGTAMVRDIYPGSTYVPYEGLQIHSSVPGHLTNLNGTLYFSAYSKETGRELWKSDGTSSGTVVVADLFPNDAYTDPEYPNSSNVSGVINRNGFLFFAASDGSGSRFWSSDGTSAGTSPVTTAISGLSNVSQMVNLNGRMLFVTNGDVLWTSDGTTSGTKILRDISPLSFANPRIQNLVVHENRIFFSANDGIHGQELWRSDGTVAGTVMVRDIHSVVDPSSNRAPGSYPAEFTALNGSLFFTADDGRNGRELWRTNGTAPGISRVTEVIPGPQGSNPAGLMVWNNSILFSADSVAAGRELFRTTAKPPTINNSESSVTWTENAVARRIAPAAVLTDPDTPILNGGRLSVRVSNPVGGDQLSILPADGIFVTGNLVSYLTNVFGTIDPASSATTLVINLNLNANLRSVEKLIRAIAFRSMSENPTERERVIRISIEDGESAASGEVVRVQVVPVNDRPVLSGFPSSVPYRQNSGAGVVFGETAVVADVDSVSFAGGTLTITVTGGDAVSNRLFVSGTLFSIDAGGNLLRAGIVIATVNLSGGSGTTPLVFTFNASARSWHVQQLLRALKFRTEGSVSNLPRRIGIRLNDGAGGLSESISVAVQILN